MSDRHRRTAPDGWPLPLRGMTYVRTGPRVIPAILPDSELRILVFE